MTRHHTHSANFISIGGITLGSLGLSGAACQLSHLCCFIARVAFEILASVVPAVWHASQGLTLDHPRLLDCLCQLASIWPLVEPLAKAAF